MMYHHAAAGRGAYQQGDLSNSMFISIITNPHPVTRQQPSTNPSYTLLTTSISKDDVKEELTAILIPLCASDEMEYILKRK